MASIRDVIAGTGVVVAFAAGLIVLALVVWFGWIVVLQLLPPKRPANVPETAYNGASRLNPVEWVHCRPTEAEHLKHCRVWSPSGTPWEEGVFLAVPRSRLPETTEEMWRSTGGLWPQLSSGSEWNETHELLHLRVVYENPTRRFRRIAEECVQPILDADPKALLAVEAELSNRSVEEVAGELGAEFNLRVRITGEPEVRERIYRQEISVAAKIEELTDAESRPYSGALVIKSGCEAEIRGEGVILD